MKAFNIKRKILIKNENLKTKTPIPIKRFYSNCFLPSQRHRQQTQTEQVQEETLEAN